MNQKEAEVMHKLKANFGAKKPMERQETSHLSTHEKQNEVVLV